MESGYLYPFHVFTDGHADEQRKFAAIGILVTDKNKVIIGEYSGIRTLEVPTTFAAETLAFFMGLEFIPRYCNEDFHENYGNGCRVVQLNSDHQDIVDFMNPRKLKRNLNFLRKRRNGSSSEEEIELVRSLLESNRDIDDSYSIRYRKVKGMDRNLAHFLAKEAERALA
jgi:ribonuclease HI